MGFAYLGVALTAASILLLEIALTRVFAIMMWHHFTYLVVSVALLGLGAAGSILTARRQGLRQDLPARALALFAIGYGFSVIAAFCVATRIPISTLSIWHEKTNLALLCLLYLVVALPFLLGGFVIALALTRLASRVNRLYFFDLLGSAVGGCSSVWLLQRLGAGATVVLAGSLGVAAGSLFALAAGRRVGLASAAPLAAAGVLFVAFAGGSELLHIPAVHQPIPMAPEKEFGRYAQVVDPLRFFSATAEVEVGPHLEVPPFLGGDPGRGGPRRVWGRPVGQDGTAPTLLYEDAADLSLYSFLKNSQAATAYVAHRARGGAAPVALVIGVGGGVDVMIALAHGAGHVTAVEVNGAMVDLLTDHFGEYLGGLFGAGPHSERVTLVHAEGRAFVRGSPDRFDVIQLSGVDTFTALSMGAYTLSESYLYTTEAVKDLYAHLKEGGYINYSRFIMSYPKQPRETLRLSHIALTALEELGVAHPASQILVLRGSGWASTMIKRGAFTQLEVDALRSFAREQGFWGPVFDPLEGEAVAARLGSVVEEAALEAFRDTRGTGLPSDEAAGASSFGTFLEILSRRIRAGGGIDPEAATGRDGFDPRIERLVAHWGKQQRGFWETQRDFAKLLRSDPRARRAFVEDYEFDLRASTDDSPFFFNYYHYAGLLRGTDRKAPPRGIEIYHPDYPVGHVVLLVSLAQVLLLGALFILLPLRRLPREGLDAPNRWRIFSYFAALGVGFMLIEIVLMQKMVLFLGHPTYAVSVVLTALLAFSGLGSLSSQRIEKVSNRALYALLIVILALMLGIRGAGDHLLPQLLGWDLPARVAGVVALLAPLGFALGMPFPLGIRVLYGRAPQLLPWAWAINGFLSVFSAIFCIILAMAIGFSNVLLVAALSYAVGFLAFAPALGSGESAGRAA